MRRAAAWLAAVGALGMLVACGPPAAPPPGGGASDGGSAASVASRAADAGTGAAGAPTAAPPAPLRLRLATTSLGAPQLPVWVAQEAGLFEEQGLDLETTYISSAPTSMAALLGHEVDFLSGGVEAAVASGVEGADVAVLASSLNKVMQAIHTAPSIREPAELRGKAFGVTRIGAQSDSAARYLLRQWGLDPERDVTMIQTGGHPETLAALRSGSLEAGIISPPQSLAALDLGFAELGNLWTRSLEYPGNVIVARRLTQPESEEVARRLIRTQVLAIHRMLTDRPLAIRALLAGTRSDDVSVAERTYDLFGPYFERDLRLSRAAFHTALDDLAQSNPRAAGADPESFLDARFVEEIAASGLVERLYGSSR